MIPDQKVKLPCRARKYGVGKDIGGAIYVHRRYAAMFGDDAFALASFLPPGFDYTVVKYRQSDGAVTFIECPDFDSAPEPTVGRTCLVRPDGTTALRQALADPYIYHHKWLFVDDDYQGFDIDESRRRSAVWMQIPNIDYSRVGRRSYWQERVAPLIGKETVEPGKSA